MTTIVADHGRVPRHRPRAWVERIERSTQEQNPISAINSEAIIMRRTIEHPSLKFLLGFVFMAAGILAVLLFLPYAMPHFANPVSANDIAGNVFNAKRACLSVENPSAEFADFCADNFIEQGRGVFLKPRAEIDAPARSIAVNREHALNRYFQIDANADDVFGSSNQMIENRIAAYAHIECAVSDGQSKGLPEFAAISWAFDPGINPHCSAVNPE